MSNEDAPTKGPSKMMSDKELYAACRGDINYLPNHMLGDAKAKLKNDIRSMVKNKKRKAKRQHPVLARKVLLGCGQYGHQGGSARPKARR